VANCGRRERERERKPSTTPFPLMLAKHNGGIYAAVIYSGKHTHIHTKPPLSAQILLPLGLLAAEAAAEKI